MNRITPIESTTPPDQWWWKEYRNNTKHRKKIDKEKLLRKSFSNSIKELCKYTSLPRVAKVFDPSFTKVERLCWTIALLFAASVVILNVYLVWTEALANPLIVSMESNTYPIRLIEFPAVALCNANRISKRVAKEKAETILRPMFPHKPMEELIQFVELFGKLIDFELADSFNFMSLVSNIPVNFIEQFDLLTHMEQLSPNCESMLKVCAWSGSVVPCSEVFKVRRTAHGHCCVFNYMMEWDSSGRPLRLTEDPKRQRVPGDWFGLGAVVDPQLEDYAYPIHNLKGFDILIFDSNHYPDHNNGLLIHRIAEPNEVIYIEIESRKQIATNEVRKYSHQTRKCFFKDERPKEFGNLYTYSSCIINCRIQTIQSLCKCTPYFLPVTNESTPICTLNNLECLHKYKAKFLYLYPLDPITNEGLGMEISDSLFCDQCMPDCEYTRHYTKSSVSVAYSGVKDVPVYLFQGINMTDKCFINIYRPSADGILDKLDVVTYWYELLSNFGGAAGLLIGYSLVTTVEFIYFMTIRYFTYYIENMKKYQRE